MRRAKRRGSARLGLSSSHPKMCSADMICRDTLSLITIGAKESTTILSLVYRKEGGSKVVDGDKNGTAEGTGCIRIMYLSLGGNGTSDDAELP